MLSERYEPLGRWETVLPSRGDFSDLLLLQTVRCEELLRRCFLDGSEGPLAVPVVNSLAEQPKLRSLIVSFLEQPLEPTLGIIEIWLVGLRAALQKDDAAVRVWVEDRFRSPVSRFQGEAESAFEHFLQDGLVRFVGQVRERFRNPLVHGRSEAALTADAYRA